MSKPRVEKTADLITKWIGSPASLLVHTLFFSACFALPALGIDFEEILLVLTTVVSLEAIYLAIFIQMTVNKTTESLEEVEEDIDEIQKDVDEIQEDVDEITDDEQKEEEDRITIEAIKTGMQKIISDIEKIKNNK